MTQRQVRLPHPATPPCLSRALTPTLKPPPVSPQEILREGDTDHDGQLDFEEFARFLQERERRLRLMFHRLDRNRDGTGTPGTPIASP